MNNIPPLKPENWVKLTLDTPDLIETIYRLKKETAKYICIDIGEISLDEFSDKTDPSIIKHENSNVILDNSHVIYCSCNNKLGFIKNSFEFVLNSLGLVDIDKIPKFKNITPDMKLTKVLLSRNNYNGYKLEKLLEDIIYDINVKSGFVKDKNTDMSNRIVETNNKTIEHLKCALDLQTKLYETIDNTLGENKGPTKPRV